MVEDVSVPSLIIRTRLWEGSGLRYEGVTILFSAFGRFNLGFLGLAMFVGS